MVAGTYSLTKSFKQGSVPVPVSEAHNKEVQSGMSHQPVSHSQPVTIQQEAIVHSFPPPQQRRPQTAQATSGPLFHIPDSEPENSASVGSLQDVIPDLENPPAEVKSKPISAMGARESLLVLPPPQPSPGSFNTSYTVIKPGATPIEGTNNQVCIERSTSSLSDASTQTILKGSPLKQGKQMYKLPSHACEYWLPYRNNNIINSSCCTHPVYTLPLFVYQDIFGRNTYSIMRLFFVSSQNTTGRKRACIPS